MTRSILKRFVSFSLTGSSFLQDQGRPDDAGISLAAIKELGPTLPILGVCLGHQSIGSGLWRQDYSVSGFNAR